MAVDSVRRSRTGEVRSRRLRGFSLIELLVVLAIIGILVALLLPATRSARPAARRTQCMNNLKQIGIALHNYHDAYGALPPAYTVDADGKPLHSWRTLILPFLEQAPLYGTIDLSKPWNDPANEAAFRTGVQAFRCPEASDPSTNTTYLAVVASGGCFRPGASRPFSEVTDSHGQTLMVIEVESAHAVHWMSPKDADETRVLGFGPEGDSPHAGGVHAAFVDGSVRLLAADMPAAQRRALVSVAGGDDDQLPQ